MNKKVRFARQTGATVVEIMISLAIVAIVMMLAVPSFSAWLQNSQIRTAAESILSGVQLARAQAVATNSHVCIQFYNAGGASNTGTQWRVYGPSSATAANGTTVVTDADCSGTGAPTAGLPIQTRAGSEGARNVTVAVTSVGGFAASPTYMNFNGLGNVTYPGGVTTIDVQNSTGTCLSASGTMRCLRIVVAQAGQVRMCDPSANTGDPTKC